jgi:diguanylate cyclase (GGDEF)-like protein/PAS domain S-box-containing protein
MFIWSDQVPDSVRHHVDSCCTAACSTARVRQRRASGRQRAPGPCRTISPDSNLLQASFNAYSDAVFVFVYNGPSELPLVVGVNDAACRSLGWKRNQLLGMTALDIDADMPRDAVIDTTAVAPGQSGTFESHHRTRDGRTFPVEVMYSVFEFGQRIYSIAAARDISARQRAIEQLRAQEAEFHSLAEHIPDNVVRLDREGRAIYINPEFANSTRHEQIIALGKTAVETAPQWDMAALFDRTVAHVLATGELRELELFLTGAEGVPVWHHVRFVAEHNDAGRIASALAIGRDITDFKRQQAELNHIATHDPLTGLPNRRLLRDRLVQAISRARRKGARLAVGYVDLDGFKRINDAFGHDTGDSVLAEVAIRLKAILREDDTVVRVGGDEFVIVFNETSGDEECLPILERILEALAGPISLPRGPVTVSASIGIAFFPDDAELPDTLVRYADQAMYAAKLSGKNRYCAYGTPAFCGKK